MKLPSRLISMLALLFLTPALAFADEQGKHADKDKHRGGYDKHMERMAERLELSEFQREQWSALHEEHHPRMREIHQEMREQRKALKSASEDGFDEFAAETAAERIGELTREATLMRARMHAEVRELLTEEQLDRFGDLHKKKAKRGHGKHHGGYDKED